MEQPEALEHGPHLPGVCAFGFLPAEPAGAAAPPDPPLAAPSSPSGRQFGRTYVSGGQLVRV
eukprot:8294604-Alexandrium_andersonii.AAC.1